MAFVSRSRACRLRRPEAKPFPTRRKSPDFCRPSRVRHVGRGGHGSKRRSAEEEFRFRHRYPLTAGGVD